MVTGAKGSDMTGGNIDVGALIERGGSSILVERLIAYLVDQYPEQVEAALQRIEAEA